MNHFICETCGIQYEKSTLPPDSCLICTDERQYVASRGQSWTTLDEMILENKYKNDLCQDEENLYSITTNPNFGIGQTAYIIQNQGFNILWDCVTYIDNPTVQAILELGGIDAIALSHPHYYATQVEWAETFDALLYIHEDDKEWVTRPSERIVFWAGEKRELNNGLILHRLGGHFKGGSVLEWQHGNQGLGVLLSGDIIQVVPDQNWVSFMYSYPNLIPLPALKVTEMVEKIQMMQFDRIYNAFHRMVIHDGKSVVQRSANRYIRALKGKLFET